MQRKLNARQERFIAEYLVDHNASAAARRAGYADSTKGTHACRLLKDPRVAARLALEMNDMLAHIKLGALDTLRARARVAFFDPAEVLDAAGRPRPFGELKEETRAVLAIRYELKESGPVVRVRQCAREPALSALERYQAAAQKLQRQMLAEMPWQADEDEDEEGGGEGTTPADARSKAPRVVLDYERMEATRTVPAPRQQVAQAHATAPTRARAAATASVAAAGAAPTLATHVAVASNPTMPTPTPAPTPPDPLRQLVEARVAQAAQVLLREAERKAGRAPAGQVQTGQVQAPRHTPQHAPQPRRDRPSVGDPGPVFYNNAD